MLVHKDFASLRRRRTDSDSGIHSFGSNSSRVGARPVRGQRQPSGDHSWRDNILSDWDIADTELFELINSEIRQDFNQRMSVRSKSCDEKYKEKRIQRSLMSSSIRNNVYHKQHQEKQHNSSGRRAPSVKDVTKAGADTRRSRSCVTGARVSSGMRHESGTEEMARRMSLRSRVTTHRLSLFSSSHHIPRVLLPPAPGPGLSVSLASLSDPDLSSSPASSPDPDTEERLSLAFIRTSAVQHQYVASRGQRERETEIYEVVPPTLLVRRRSLRQARARSSSDITRASVRTSQRRLIL